MKQQTDYGLSNTEIKDIIQVLKKNKKIKKVVLFGSRAKGTFKNGSDIDLALIGNDLSLNDVLDLSVEIEYLFLPYRFDFVIYNTITEPALLDHIDKFGVMLFSRNCEGHQGDLLK